MEFAIRGDHITLGQLLKVTGQADEAGGVKALLAERPILVNGEAESRRGRKLRVGDSVDLPDGTSVQLTSGGEPDEA